MPTVADLLGTSTKPKVTDLLGSPDSRKPSIESLLGKADDKEGWLSHTWGQVTKPIREMPGNIKKEFEEGSATVKEAMGEAGEKLKKGEQPGLANTLKAVGGAAGQAFAPVTGAVKSLFTHPAEETLGTKPIKPGEGLTANRAKHLLVDTGENAMMAAGPGVAGKIAKAGAKAAGEAVGGIDKIFRGRETKLPTPAIQPPTPTGAVAAPGTQELPVGSPLTERPAVTNPRRFEDQLFQLEGNASADRIEATKRLEAIPKAFSDGTKISPETWEKFYHYQESLIKRPRAGAPEAVNLTPEEKALFDQHVAPVLEENQKYYQA